MADGSGQCVEMPAEDANYPRKVSARSYPTREYMGLVFAYFGEGEPPAFPPFPASPDESLVHVWNTETVPCNWLQCYENSADEVHVAFVHRPGGSHAAIAELPEISAEETDWGMLRLGTRKGGKVRVSLHYMPNVTRVVVPPLAGFDGIGGWSEIFFSFTPVDDENHLWLITSQVKVSGSEAEKFLQKKAAYLEACARAPKVLDLVHDVWAGRRRLIDIEHPDLAIVQDIAVQAGQGRIADRDHERLGRSDTAIILWRKILARELRAIAEGHSSKKWRVAPVDVVFDENTTLQPDILFVSSARRGIIGPEYVLGPPDLVVEILSPYRVPHDRVTKFAQYAHYGVGEYWIVDPVAESVEVYRLAGSKYELTASLSGDQTLETPLLPGWRVIVRDLFAA